MNWNDNTFPWFTDTGRVSIIRLLCLCINVVDQRGIAVWRASISSVDGNDQVPGIPGLLHQTALHHWILLGPHASVCCSRLPFLLGLDIQPRMRRYVHENYSGQGRRIIIFIFLILLSTSRLLVFSVFSFLVQLAILIALHGYLDNKVIIQSILMGVKSCRVYSWCCKRAIRFSWASIDSLCFWIWASWNTISSFFSFFSCSDC